MEPINGITREEREAVLMIQILLALQGMLEREAVSLANWRIMTDQEKEQTRQSYQAHLRQIERELSR